jgi:hypothetical protein
MGITGTIRTAEEIRFELRNAIIDGALDPEFVDHINEHLADGDSYRRFVNTAAIMYAAFGDEFVRRLNLDPRDHVL